MYPLQLAVHSLKLRQVLPSPLCPPPPPPLLTKPQEQKQISFVENPSSVHPTKTPTSLSRDPPPFLLPALPPSLPLTTSHSPREQIFGSPERSFLKNPLTDFFEKRLSKLLFHAISMNEEERVEECILAGANLDREHVFFS